MSSKQNRVLGQSVHPVVKRGATRSLTVRLALIIAPVVLLLIGVVSPVVAVPPIREDVPFSAFTIPAGPLGCSVDVLVEPLTNKEKQTTFLDQAGNLRVAIISGALKVRVTNLSTDVSLDLNISGPIQLAPQADGSLSIVTGGATLWWFFEPGVAPGQPIVGLYHGKTVSEAGSAGFRFLEAKGHVQDVCALLGA